MTDREREEGDGIHRERATGRGNGRYRERGKGRLQRGREREQLEEIRGGAEREREREREVRGGYREGTGDCVTQPCYKSYTSRGVGMEQYLVDKQESRSSPAHSTSQARSRREPARHNGVCG